MRTNRKNIAVLAALAFVVTPFSVASADETAKKPTMVDVFGAGKLTVPGSFKKMTPKSRIIAHEFQAKEGEGDSAKTARVTFMAAGGDVETNIKRWKGQFSGGDAAGQKVEEMKVGNWKVHLVDVSGAYQERMGGPFAGGKMVERKDYAMTGAIILHPEGRKYFVKMIGPMSVVKKNRKTFVDMIKTIGK